MLRACCSLLGDRTPEPLLLVHLVSRSSNTGSQSDAALRIETTVGNHAFRTLFRVPPSTDNPSSAAILQLCTPLLAPPASAEKVSSSGTPGADFNELQISRQVIPLELIDGTVVRCPASISLGATDVGRTTTPGAEEETSWLAVCTFETVMTGDFRLEPDQEREHSAAELVPCSGKHLPHENCPCLLKSKEADGATVESPAGPHLGDVVVLSTDNKIKDLEAQVQQLAAKLDQALATKSRFLATMSHELLVPLVGVIGMSEHLSKQPTVPNVIKDSVATILESALSLNSTITDILDYSSLSKNELELDRSEFDIHEVVRDAMAAVSHKLLKLDLEINCQSVPETLSHVVGDAMRFKQIVVHLLNNAIKFTEPGGVIDLRVSSRVLDHPRSSAEIHISVSDTGVGIDPEFKDWIFCPFSQQDPTLTRKYGGTGIGLTICRQLVERMHGSIWYESEMGRGSTFHVTIQVGIPSQRVVTAAKPFHTDLRWRRRCSKDRHETNPFLHLVENPLPVSCSSSAVEVTAGQQILVVEDSRLCQKVLLNMLGEKRDITVANNGAEALQLIKDRLEQEGKAWDCILMDVSMPVMDGLECTRQIRSLFSQWNYRPWIIALTAQALEEDRRLCLRSGMDVFLSKPVTKHRLEQELTRALR